MATNAEDSLTDRVTPVITDEEKIVNAQMYKNAGNDCYKTKDYRGAIGRYHRAILQLKGVGQSANLGRLLGIDDGHSLDNTLTPQLHEQLQSLKMDCYNNLAACLLQQGEPNYKRISEYCDNVLEISPENVKASYRKGVALYHLGKYDDAEEILKHIYNKDPAVKKYLSLCKQALAKQNKELKETYKSMFASKKQTDKSENKTNGVDT